MEFSRQEYWSGLSLSSPGDLPDPGIEPRSPAMQADALPSEPPEKPQIKWVQARTHTLILSVFPLLNLSHKTPHQTPLIETHSFWGQEPALSPLPGKAISYFFLLHPEICPQDLIGSGAEAKLMASVTQYICSSNLILSVNLRLHSVAQTVKPLPAVQETHVWSLDWGDLLEKEMATHSSTLT